MSTELLGIIGALVAAGALFYQARSYHLSRRELSLKVHDLSEVVRRLEDETRSREQLREKHEGLHGDTLRQYADALNYTTKISRLHQESMAAEASTRRGALWDTQSVLMAVIHVVRSVGAYPTDNVSRVLSAAAALCGARIRQMEMSEMWDKEREAIDAPEVDPSHPDAARLFKERNEHISREIARLEGKYADEVRAKNDVLREARAEFLSIAKTLEGP